MKKLLVIFLSFCALTVNAQVTRPAAEHKIDSLLPSNQSRVITPERIRKALGAAMDYAASSDTIGSKKIVGELDIISGNLGLVVGGVNGTNLRTDSTEKRGRIAVASWSKNRLPYALISGVSKQNDGTVYIGGGHSSAYAVNYIQEYTVNSVGTTGGSIRRVVNPDGSHWFGSSPLMDGFNLATFNGNANVKGQLTTQNVIPDTYASRTVGSLSFPYNNVYSFYNLSPQSYTAGTTGTSYDVLFRQGTGSQIVGGYLANTGEHFIQAPGVKPAAKGVQFANYGTSWLGGDVTITGGMSVGGGIIPGTDNTFRVGAINQRYYTGYFSNLFLGNINRSFNISQTDNTINTVFRIHPTTGGITIQPPGSIPPDRGFPFDVAGNAAVQGTLTLNDGVITKFTAGSYNFDTSVSSAGIVTAGTTVRGATGIIAGASAAPDASAVLEARSTARGFLPPRMSAAQRTAIVSPAVGLIVVQTDGGTAEGLWINLSTGWKQLAFVP